MFSQRKSALAIVVCLATLTPAVLAKEYLFEASQLQGDVSNADIALFNEGGQLPGNYHVDVLVNGEQVDSREIFFRQRYTASGRPVLEPCLNRKQLAHYGVKVEDYPALDDTRSVQEGSSSAKTGVTMRCVDLSVIPQAYADFQFSAQRVLLSIPQIAVHAKLKGIAPYYLWDDGIPALLMNYQYSTVQTDYRGYAKGRDESQYAVLEPGINLGAWRLRNNTTWRKNNDRSGRWQSSYTYAERGLNSFKSRLTLGERFTSSEVFDNVPFRGVMLGSDEAMVPSHLRMFSPVVRGIARTQARVEIKQNGYTLFNSVVAQGPFALSDFSAADGGDLQVTVWETDGSPQTYTVPYQTPAIALHEGYLNYNLMAGQYRSADSSIQASSVAQATAMYGLPWDLTVYGGIQGAAHYHSFSAGIGKSLGSWGSLSLDSTQARGVRQGKKAEQGGTWRLRYSKAIEETNTHFILSSYQYASSGYSTLSEVLDTYYKGGASGNEGWFENNRDRRKTRSTLTISQSLKTLGYLNFNGSRENYWNRTGYNDSFGASYGVGLRDVSLSLSWMQNRSRYAGQQNNEQIFSFMASMSLDRWMGSAVRANYQMSSSSSGGETQQAGLSGQAFDRQLNWTVNQQYRSGIESGDRNNSAMQLGWYGGYGQLTGNYSYSPSIKQLGMGASGGVVISSDGVTFAQPLDMNNGIALVAAPGAFGVPVGGWPGVKTDFRGYTTLSYLSPYQENSVSLDPSWLPADAEIVQTDVRVVPTKGAIIPARFVTQIGGRALITLKNLANQPVPFGALATLEERQTGIAGVVGDSGQVYFSGLQEEGELSVKWGPSLSQQCRAAYRLPENKELSGIYLLTAVCR